MMHPSLLKTAYDRQSRSNLLRAGFKKIEVVIVVAVFLLILGAIAMPNAPHNPDGARKAEAKQNLHAIQIAVERYTVDNDGQYPPFLVGGSREYSVTVAEKRGKTHFSDTGEAAAELAIDPLVREGYMPKYPSNPFAKAAEVHSAQLAPGGSNQPDPLRNGSAEAKLHGTRFGPECRLMGSVLGERRFSDWTTANGTVYPSYAEVDYGCWDVWDEEGKKVRQHLPGQFFYKGIGPAVAVSEDSDTSDPILPMQIDLYMLGVYGPSNFKGQDVLGKEQPLPVIGSQDGRIIENPDEASLVYYGLAATEEGIGSPFSFNELGGFDYYNSNGLQDGVLMVMLSGEDFSSGDT